MSTIVNLQIPFVSLVEAIASLNLEDKYKLREILEDQLFEAEEEMENDPDVLAEVEQARREYQVGDYLTLQDYIASRAENPS
jgi:regulator of replication initiation timing